MFNVEIVQSFQIDGEITSVGSDAQISAHTLARDFR